MAFAGLAQEGGLCGGGFAHFLEVVEHPHRGAFHVVQVGEKGVGVVVGVGIKGQGGGFVHFDVGWFDFPATGW